MNIGIVGSEAAKFTSITEDKARQIIRSIISGNNKVVSGKCHLGGIDIWAIEEAIKLGLPYIEFPPKRLTWSNGYKERNLQIAKNSDMVFCITLKELPDTYIGMKFTYCYHCNTNTHIKSGGCWTVKQAKLMGKPGEVIVIS